LPDLAPLPWLYSYREDPYSTRLGEPVFRPFVEISLANGGRFAQAVAIENRDAFDERFGTVLSA
jgi:hypothetical protein